MNPDVTIVLGPPGTGKTHHLLDVLEKEIEQGVDPARIAFCSFTRRAAHEASARTEERFGYDAKDLPYFRTLHSLAFKEIGAGRDDIVNHKHLREVGDVLGLEFQTKKETAEEAGLPSAKYRGDRYIFIDTYARSRQITHKAAWYELADDGDELNWFEFRRFMKMWEDYKADRRLVDFTALLERYWISKQWLDVDVAIIDEAQDLSTLQWKMAMSVFSHCKRIYIAGDDDQAIFQWSGADVGFFLALRGAKVFLHHSHRVPDGVFEHAAEIAGRISHRYTKQWESTGRKGSIEYHRDLDSLDVTSGDWLLLARSTYQLHKYVALARGQGVNYAFRGEHLVNPSHVEAIQLWERLRKGAKLPKSAVELLYPLLCTEKRNACKSKILKHDFVAISDLGIGNSIWHETLTGIPLVDKEYYISLLRRGEKLTAEPKVHINTIHGVKGGEATNVALLTDISDRTHKGSLINPDAEHRVFYVGTTRAKENLHVIVPQTRKYYDY